MNLKSKRQARFSGMQSMKTADIMSIMQRWPKNRPLQKMLSTGVAIKGKGMHQISRQMDFLYMPVIVLELFLVLKYFLSCYQEAIKKSYVITLYSHTRGNITQDN